MLCERGTEILVPRPGFPLIQPICHNLGVKIVHYNLIAEKEWDIDLADLRSKITTNTRAILVNNPSNPCGSCFSEEHMREILKLCDEVEIPLIADEVYYGLSYSEKFPFIPFADLTSTVPIISCGALSKIYCLPGWRVGWMLVYNNSGYFDKILPNMHKLCMVQLHPNSLVMAALPKILSEVGQDHM